MRRGTRKILLGIGVLGFGLAAFAGCSSDPVAMPDVEGLSLSDVRDQLQELGLEVDAHDASADPRAILMESNWIVMRQGVTAGAAVDEGTTVSLEVVKNGEGPGGEVPAAPAAPAADTTAAMTHLATLYSDKNWVSLIDGIEDRGGVLWVNTSLYPDSDAVLPAEEICVALSGYQIQKTPEFTGVTVRASDAWVLSSRRTLSDSCDAELPEG